MVMGWDSRIEPWLDRYPALRAIGHTPLVPVDLFRNELPDVEVLAKMECLNPGGSLKDRPVLRMLLGALADGRLQRGRTILDSSSGNAGIAYAMIGRMIGWPVEIVIPDNASAERKKRLRAHGAELVLTDALLGYDEALREVNRRAHAHPDRYFFCDQYSNDDNWRAHYETTAEEILHQTDGRLTHVVAGVGTGGTITGLGRRLKEHDPRIRVVCILPEAFPGVEGLKPLGRAEDIVPAILDEKVIDERVPVSVDEAYRMCVRLAASSASRGVSAAAASSRCSTTSASATSRPASGTEREAPAPASDATQVLIDPSGNGFRRRLAHPGRARQLHGQAEFHPALPLKSEISYG